MEKVDETLSIVALLVTMITQRRHFARSIPCRQNNGWAIASLRQGQQLGTVSRSAKVGD